MRKKDFKFDKRADKYDSEFEGKLSEKFYPLLTDNITLSVGSSVLDVGCGTGTILKRLSKKCSIRGYGIDTEEKMIEQAVLKCPDMDIRLCSCAETSFNDKSFDIIVACMAYHHFSDKDKFVAEAARLLKSGGRLYIADPKFPYLVRKAINAALYIHRITGKFFTAEEISDNFADFGFKLLGSKSDSFAQMVVLAKT